MVVLFVCLVMLILIDCVLFLRWLRDVEFFFGCLYFYCDVVY